ncbi:MAG: DUF433 domain-containing protein [Dehalococcoidia bacterium]
MSISPDYVDIGTFIDQREDYRGGRPFIVGTGITVDAISCVHRIDGWEPAQIAAEFDITLPQVLAALTFYFANREAIDQFISRYDDETDEFVANYRAKQGQIRK